MNLKTQLSQVSGIGPGTAYRLGRLNLNTVWDLIFHFPFRYDDFSNNTSALDAKVGENVSLQGEIWSIGNIYTRSRKIITKAVFNDGTSPIELIWFNSSWLARQIRTGDRLQISGRLQKYKNKLSIMMPVWEKTAHLGGAKAHPRGVHTGRLVPVYPETEGLSSKWLRGKINAVLPQVLQEITDPLPDIIRKEMLSLDGAIEKIHFPETWEDVEKSRQRLGFDELFYVLLATRKARLEWEKKPIVKPMRIESSFLGEFESNLPYKLTFAQQKVLQEIAGDLSQNKPMNRLVQGEVGSGKTAVSAGAAYLAFKNGLKTLFMAPTEILAFQHFDTLSTLLKPLGVSVGIYTGSKKKTTDKDNIIVGTHALLSKKLTLKNTGLIIVDEQQRFGVEQRTTLRNKAKVPHFLTMTATPIPRTVALTIYGDLDMSVIDEMPQGRQKVKTFLVPEKKRADSYKFIDRKISKGDQAYIITPLIEASETLTSVKAAKEEFEKLKTIFPDFKLALLHGRMKGREKEKIIKAFKSGKIKILVSTSVVEVGMDNSNASIIVIEGAERFGLAQLHQLRGRVGRGNKESFCFLYTSNPYADDRSRLRLLETTYDGLRLAEEDLKIRGGGQIFGTAQSGRILFKIASFSDTKLLEKARSAAEELLRIDPALDKYPDIKAKLHEMISGAMPD